MRQSGTRNACKVWIIVAAIAAATPGCANDRGPVRVHGLSRSSTVGSDLRRVPRGVTVPPPSLGVDLVRGRETRRNDDTEAIRAGASGPERLPGSVGLTLPNVNGNTDLGARRGQPARPR